MLAAILSEVRSLLSASRGGGGGGAGDEDGGTTIDAAAAAAAEQTTSPLLGPATPFAQAGLDSLDMLKAASALSEALGVELPSTALFDHPSAAKLAAAQTALKIATAQRDAAEEVRTEAEIRRPCLQSVC